MTVFLSGASAGLGAALCKLFLAQGHRVYAGVRSIHDVKELEPVKGHAALTLCQLDISRQKDIDAVRQTVEAETKELDILLNVAGVLLNREGTILGDSFVDLDRTFKVNTIGPVSLVNALFPLLRRSPRATVINISSEVRSIDGVGPKFAAYCMSKTAIAQYGFILKATLEEIDLDMRVFSVHPGRMKTAMGAENGQIEAEESARGIYRIAIGEVLADNREVYVDYRGRPMLGNH